MGAVTGVLTLAAGFPTVIFTVLLGLSLIYWLFVLVGAVDLDGGGAAEGLEGAAKGALEGAAKGALEGAAKGVLEGGAKAALEGVADGVDVPDGADAPEGGVLATLASALRLRDAPVTVILSFFSLFGWLGSSLAMMSLGGLGLPTWLIGLPVLLVVSVLSLILTSFAVRPVAPLFQTRHAKQHTQLVGRVAVVSTGRVDEGFGQANLEDGGAGLIIQVRAAPSLGLAKGDRCLIVDQEGGIFRIERMTDLLADSGAPVNAELLREAQAEVEALASQEASEAAAAAQRARRG